MANGFEPRRFEYPSITTGPSLQLLKFDQIKNVQYRGHGGGQVVSMLAFLFWWSKFKSLWSLNFFFKNVVCKEQNFPKRGLGWPIPKIFQNEDSNTQLIGLDKSKTTTVPPLLHITCNIILTVGKCCTEKKSSGWN